MMVVPHNLTDEHCDCLNKVLEAVPKALELAQACKDCGWPADEFIAQLQAQQQMATVAKAKFFPNRP